MLATFTSFYNIGCSNIHVRTVNDIYTYATVISTSKEFSQ